MQVSLVIPVYNEEKCIKACLESVFSQTRLPDEVIVVDNNCLDETVTIARQYPVRIIREMKQGIAHARNAGFDAAKGDIIARTDADTVLPPNWLERICDTFQLHPEIDAVTGSAVLEGMSYASTLPYTTVRNFMRVLQGGNDVLMGFNMAFRRPLWKRVRPFVSDDDELVNEDLDLSLTMISHGGRIKWDRDLICRTSARRLKTPFSFFVGYPMMTVRTFAHHSNKPLVRSILKRIPRRVSKRVYPR